MNMREVAAEELNTAGSIRRVFLRTGNRLHLELVRLGIEKARAFRLMSRPLP